MFKPFIKKKQSGGMTLKKSRTSAWQQVLMNSKSSNSERHLNLQYLIDAHNNHPGKKQME